MATISVRQLRAWKACEEQVKVFEKEWGSGKVEITLAGLKRAATLGLDLGWLARRILTNAELAEYNKAVAPAWAEYNKAVAPAWAEYNKAVAEYDKAVASARAEYDKATAPALWERPKGRG